VGANYHGIVEVDATWGSLHEVESDSDIGCPWRDWERTRCTQVRPLMVEVKT
jgi:hypothetical protein